MPTLSPCLWRLFSEIDARWPHRNHGIDGWYRNPRDGISVGHNPGVRGLVHAIDVDRRGIDPDWIVANIYKGGHILWYMIWNRTLHSRTYGWNPRPYTRPNPHTDHIHIEVYQEVPAEQYAGPWQIAPASEGFGDAPQQGIGAAGDWQYSQYIDSMSTSLAGLALESGWYGDGIAQLRT